MQGQGAVGRVPRAYGGSNSTCLTPRTPVFGLLPGARSSADCEPAQINFRAEGALSSGCTTTDYSPTILECPRDAHRGCSERYPDLFKTWKVAQNRHEPRPWIVLQGQEAVGRVPRAYGGSNSTCLTGRTSSFRAPAGSPILPGSRKYIHPPTCPRESQERPTRNTRSLYL